ncbi:hypothetical protein TNCV_4676381 [Trichonephila clavipes]|nr:hypothetical protein TNCV_4676381 [Trichonephila clavipes]
MSATLRPYLTAVRHTLNAAMCLENFSSQVVERHNKPEVEESPHPWRRTEKSAKSEQDGAKRNQQWQQENIAG